MTDYGVLELPRDEREPDPFVAHRARGPSRFQISLPRPEPSRPIIHAERAWRRPDILDRMELANPGLLLSRWQGTDRNEHAFEIAGDYHILAVAQQPSRFSLRLGAKFFPHQEVVPGAIQITPPGLPARVVHSRPYDILHFHIPNLLLMECFEWSHGKWPTDGIALRDPLSAHDALLQNLCAALLSIAGTDDPNGGLFADFLSLAIVTHLLGSYGDVAPASARKASALPKWRLKRATEFIETHLDSPLALADVAGAAGLSRMHFAAQFRAATGVRPHEYVLRRRIEKAQAILATTDMPIAELSFASGFSSQAHFTVVFKRFSGLTPRRWRQSHRA
ncbi:MAG TPA: AraC family transcriptional regulator [Rhizomicrobium sp.]